MSSNESVKQELLSEEFMSPRETARCIGRTVETLCRWRWKKLNPELEYIKVGKLIRYRASTVLAFIKANTVGGTH